MAKFDIEYNLLQDAEVVVAVEKDVEVAVVVTEVAAWNAISIGNLAMIGRKFIFFEVTKCSKQFPQSYFMHWFLGGKGELFEEAKYETRFRKDKTEWEDISWL